MISLFPANNAEAATPISGGHTTRATAYNWGAYSNGKSVMATLPAGEDVLWVSFTVPSNSRIYVRCSYDNEYEEMILATANATGNFLDLSDTVINPNSLIPFLASDINNTVASTQTFYAVVFRPDGFSGDMIISLTLYDRIKTGNGTFNFSGSASNPGNASMSTTGVESGVLSLNLSNNTSIPPNAIVTSVSTTGTQSPNQGNVRHMIAPTNPANIWFTSIVSSSTSGTYNIDISNALPARQTWQFKYNALATAKSTMSNVKLTLKWEYDIAETNYATY